MNTDPPTIRSRGYQPCQVDLVLLGQGKPRWRHGEVHTAEPSSTALTFMLHRLLENSDVSTVQLWDPALGQPNEDQVLRLLTQPSDFWHAGLRLGVGGKPELIDYVQPTWMFNRDPAPDIEATSWRVSLRACLVRMEVIRKLGFLRPEFTTLEAAALEWGHRLIVSGVLMRHVPNLLAAEFQPSMFNRQRPTMLPLGDELRFVHYRFGRQWAAWALFRALMTRYTTLPTALRAWREVMSTPRPAHASPFRSTAASPKSQVRGCSLSDLPANARETEGAQAEGAVCKSLASARVTVLIPTVDRYPYLRVLLGQLRHQTVPPCEIIVVDQTDPELRDPALATEFSDLPLKLIYRGAPGQCSSRNAGLEIALGDRILLLDDDVEVSPHLIESHLATLERFQAASSSGVAQEVGDQPLPEAIRCIRPSDVFPAGNTMIRRSALELTGLFDLAYEKGARADGDLGLRLYLAGELMILNGGIEVLHHRAPAGGLRAHRAREITQRLSRTRLFYHNLPSITEMYLVRRQFSPKQEREAIWLRILGTFGFHGGRLQRVLKIFISAFALPRTLCVILRNRRLARQMLVRFPVIATLPKPARLPDCVSARC